MDIRIPQWLAPWLIGVGLLSFALALIMAIRAYMNLRRAGYYVIREAARRTVVRSSLLVLLFLLLTIGLALIPRQAPAPEPLPTATRVATDTPVPTSMPTATPTSTPMPTATEPFIPTSTPMATLPVTFTTPLPSAVAPPGDARFELWTLAQGVDENGQPVNPGTRFPPGLARVYLFFRYDGLVPDVPWTILWYQNGELLTGDTELWDATDPSGVQYRYLEFANGFPPGEYEGQVWLGDRLQIRAPFSVASEE